MKKILILLLCAAMLTGCAASPGEAGRPAVKIPQPRLDDEIIDIDLLENDISAGSGVHVSRDIVYYEEKTEYESGNPYGEGESWEMHSAEEAAEHLVVCITEPGTYRVSGKLEKGQIRVDLGEDAAEDPHAVVNLILDGADITCTVAPAILFQNVYECDGDWSVDTAHPDVDTAAAGANLILAEGSRNIVNGSHVAKIYKDKDGEKKLWKQDGAIYSYMSMNVFGPGSLDLYADNEGLDTELHLTICGGDINIFADNDGINTNEDGVSVTTILDGNLHILAGLGAEGDGIDSNGYLVIRGGTVVSCANPASDAGLDSDKGSYIHGGTVIALGSTMDWAESDSDQVTMNLQFAQMQGVGSDIRVIKEDGTEVFSYDPMADQVLSEGLRRSYMGAVISCPAFAVGDTYQIYVGDTRMAYTGTDVMRHPGPMGDFGGEKPEGMEFGTDRQPPQGDRKEPPEGMDSPPDGWTMPSMPDGQMPVPPQGQEKPQGFGDFSAQQGQAQSLFYMQDKVNFFSGLTPAE